MDFEARSESDRDAWFTRLAEALSERLGALRYVALEDRLAAAARSFNGEVFAIWQKAMLGEPGKLIATDVPRLARSFAIFEVETGDSASSGGDPSLEEQLRVRKTSSWGSPAPLLRRESRLTAAEDMKASGLEETSLQQPLAFWPAAVELDAPAGPEAKRGADAVTAVVIEAGNRVLRRRRLDDCQLTGGSVVSNFSSVMSALCRALLPSEGAAAVLRALQGLMEEVVANKREMAGTVLDLFKVWFPVAVSVPPPPPPPPAKGNPPYLPWLDSELCRYRPLKEFDPDAASPATSTVSDAAVAAAAAAASSSSPSSPSGAASSAEPPAGIPQPPLPLSAEYLRGATWLLAILKLCNQNCLFPSVRLLKRVVLPDYPTRDKRHGWRIAVEIEFSRSRPRVPVRAIVTHTKREVSEKARLAITW